VVRIFQLEIFLVAQAVGAALEDADFVVEALYEAERDFVFRLAIGGNAVPVTLDHRGELFIRFEALPTQLRFPVIEKLSRPSLGCVRPKLIELLAQDVRGVQPLVRRQQQFEDYAWCRAKDFPGSTAERIFVL
jgi:hypothetical protein